MEERVHQTYRELLRELYADRIRLISGGWLVPRPNSDLDWVERIPLLKAGTLGALVGAATTALFMWSVSDSSKSLVSNLHRSGGEVAGESNLRGEIDLMQGILQGLVQSVQVLSGEEQTLKSPAATSESFPYPVKVTADKANLRSGPGWHEKRLAVLTKDTVLLALESCEGWIKVSLPKGTEGWMASDLVTVRKEG